MNTPTPGVSVSTVPSCSADCRGDTTAIGTSGALLLALIVTVLIVALAARRT